LQEVLRKITKHKPKGLPKGQHGRASDQREQNGQK